MSSFNLLLIPSNVFFITVIIVFISDWTFQKVFSTSSLKFSVSLSILPLSSLSILIISVSNSASDRLLFYILFYFVFLEFCSVLSFGTCFFVCSFWLTSHVCFYVGRSAMTLSLGRVAHIVGVLCVPVVQSLWPPEPGTSRVSLVQVVCALL